MNAHLDIVPTLVDRIRPTMVGLKMPRAIEIRTLQFSGKI
jgi:hypothetical protein